MSEAADITRKAKSNLAFALRILPAERRREMVTFYAFCRTMDDLADAPGLTVAQRAAALAEWKCGLMEGFERPSPLQREVVALRDRHGIPKQYLCAIIEGCEADLQPQPFANWAELDGYIWRVACAVGLVSVRLFGCQDPASDGYAEALGRALQLTNILRDVGEDFANGGRVYLPLEDLERFGLRPEDLGGRPSGGAFAELMAYEAGRAEEFFRQADELLPAVDRRALLPAVVMAEIYHHLLRRMRLDGFRVFETRYRISRPRKLWILLKHGVAGRLGIR